MSVIQIFIIVFLSLFTAEAVASKYNGPFLASISGAIGHAGKIKTCDIYPTYPEFKIQSQYNHIRALIDKASKQKISTSPRAAIQTPSLEYYAYRVVEIPNSPAVAGEKILLHKEYLDLQFRQGKEAKELIEFIKKHCQTE